MALPFSEHLAQWHVRQQRRGAMRYLVHAWPAALAVFTLLLFPVIGILVGYPIQGSDWISYAAVFALVVGGTWYEAVTMEALVRRVESETAGNRAVDRWAGKWIDERRPAWEFAIAWVALVAGALYGAISSSRYESLIWMTPGLLLGLANALHHHLVVDGFAKMLGRANAGVTLGTAQNETTHQD